MAMDPDDSARLFLGYHAPCTGAVGCFSESKDSGATWKTYCGDGADKSPVPREVSVPCP
jgi:hypothetical protein